MLEEAEARLIDLASAVADGRSLDWNALESSTEDPDERAVIKRLRAIADVGRVHADISMNHRKRRSVAGLQRALGAFDLWRSPRLHALRHHAVILGEELISHAALKESG